MTEGWNLLIRNALVFDGTGLGPDGTEEGIVGGGVAGVQRHHHIHGRQRP